MAWVVDSYIASADGYYIDTGQAEHYGLAVGDLLAGHSDPASMKGALAGKYGEL